MAFTPINPPAVNDTMNSRGQDSLITAVSSAPGITPGSTNYTITCADGRVYVVKNTNLTQESFNFNGTPVRWVNGQGND